MLGPALMVLGVMLPWGASPEAQGLDRWGVMVLLVGVPALLLPWAARETVVAHWVLGGLALIAAIGALGGWMAAWQAIPANIPDPAIRVGKGPLFTLAGAALTWATLPGPLRGWHRALAAGGGFGLMLAIAVGMSAWLSADKEAVAAMGSPVPHRTGTPWIIIEVHLSSETPTTRRVEPPSLAMPTSTPLPFFQGTSPEPDSFSPWGFPTATPLSEGLEPPASTPAPPRSEGPESSAPTPAPTATVLPPHSPLPPPTPPPSPLSP